MKVFLTGATGFIGSAVAGQLLTQGHTILGLVRSEEDAALLSKRGITSLHGDLKDTVALSDGAQQTDATIHLGAASGPDLPKIDSQVVETLLTSLAGTGKTLLYTSGAAVAGDTGVGIGTEETPMNPASASAWRGVIERRVLDTAKQGIRTIAIRPSMVFGHGAGGFVQFFLNNAKRTGAARTIGDGHWRWSTVYLDDIANLYLLALEKAKSGDIFLAASDEVLSFLEMAEAASHAAGAGGKTDRWEPDDARKSLGALVDLMTANTVVSGAKARQELGWNPTGPTLIEELDHGSYRLS